jgi:hypothetical protein
MPPDRAGLHSTPPSHRDLGRAQFALDVEPGREARRRGCGDHGHAGGPDVHLLQQRLAAHREIADERGLVTARSSCAERNVISRGRTRSRSGEVGERVDAVTLAYNRPDADGPPDRAISVVLLLRRPRRAAARACGAGSEPCQVLTRPGAAGGERRVWQGRGQTCGGTGEGQRN